LKIGVDMAGGSFTSHRMTSYIDKRC
jgi:hypothetical protein